MLSWEPRREMTRTGTGEEVRKGQCLPVWKAEPPALPDGLNERSEKEKRER